MSTKRDKRPPPQKIEDQVREEFKEKITEQIADAEKEIRDGFKKEIPAEMKVAHRRIGRAVHIADPLEAKAEIEAQMVDEKREIQAKYEVAIKVQLVEKEHEIRVEAEREIRQEVAKRLR